MMPMLAREVTDEEVAFYRENGWVKLEGLIDRARLADILAGCRKLLGEMEAAMASGDPRLTVGAHGERQYDGEDFYAAWYPYLFTVRHLRREPFLSFALDTSVGRAAHRLIDRARLGAGHIPVVLADNNLLVKFPDGRESNAAVRYHQDNVANIGLDRTGHINMWIALEEVPPEQGTMRYLSGSHREGPLGQHRDGLLDEYPALTKTYSWSEQMHYMPGDATVQHDYTIHGSPPNLTDKIRWGLVCTYMAADCIARPDAQLHIGMPAPMERFPQVYPPKPDASPAFNGVIRDNMTERYDIARPN
jgi:ectoine hydroxylase-related dioxygenase (phytanoyl-CoA dioxygenase family)